MNDLKKLLNQLKICTKIDDCRKCPIKGKYNSCPISHAFSLLGAMSNTSDPTREGFFIFLYGYDPYLFLSKEVDF